MGSERADRFTWERAVRDPKTGLPRDLLCLALVLATYSTGKTGDGIEVSEAELGAVLGYGPRTVRRLVGELRDGCGLIERTGGGNRYGPARYALVLPGDLAARAAAVRDRRAADRARASKQPNEPRFRPAAGGPVQGASRPAAVRPVEILDRPQGASRPAAGTAYTGHPAPPYQDQDQDPAARHKASERPGPGGPVSNSNLEVPQGAPPGPALDGRAALTGPERDPRTILAALGADKAQATAALAAIRASTPDTAGYLQGHIDRDGGAELMRWVARITGEQP